MDEAVRCLRDGCLPGRLPALVLVEDSTDVIGGPAVCAQVRKGFLDWGTPHLNSWCGLR
jgi:hypothetical protein